MAVTGDTLVCLGAFSSGGVGLVVEGSEHIMWGWLFRLGGWVVNLEG